MSSLAADLDRLDPPQHFPVRADLDLADPLQVHPRGLRVPAGAVTVFGPHHTVKPIRTLESRIPRCRTGSHSAKIPIEGPVQSAKGGLLAGERPHRRVGALTPNVLELRRLTCVGDTGPAVPPGIPALLQRRVVQLPMRLEACLQRDVLTRSRSQPKFVGAPHPNAPQRCSTPWGASAVIPTTPRGKRVPAMIRRYKPPPTDRFSTRLGVSIPRTIQAAAGHFGVH